MSGHMNGETDNTRVRTWMNDIPLGSLDQLDNAVLDHGPSVRRHETASDLPLPASRSTSASSSPISEDSSFFARSRYSVSVDSPEHLHAESPSVGSLWQIQRADLPVAHQIPLPESIATPNEQSQLHDAGSHHETTSNTSSRSNGGLHVNIRTPKGLRARNPKSSRGHRKARLNKHDDLQTINVFVPEVGDSSAPSGLNAANRSQSGQQLPKPNYWQRTAPLMDCLPHLQAIWPENGRHKNTGSVTCIDYFEGRRGPKVHNKLSISEIGSRRTFTESLEALRVAPKAGIATRVLLIEDLSAGLIESLGSVFELDPEFFAEHLNRSGYDGLDYADELPSRWETHGMPKAHASLKWYRPVHENPKITQWKKDPRSLLDRVCDNASKPSNETELSGFLGGPGIQRSSTATTWKKTPSRFLENLRPRRSKSGWTNGTEPADQRKVPGSITWSDPLYKTDGKRNKHAMRHQAVVGTNIFRRSLPLSTRPAGSKDTSVKVSGWKFGANAQSDTQAFARAARVRRMTSEDDWENDAVPIAWEEKASIFCYRKSSVPIIILLLDPLPAITDFPKLVGPLKVSLDTGSTNSSAALQPGEKPIKMGLPMFPRVPRIFPRNKFNASRADIALLKHDTSTLISTANVVRIQRDTEMSPWPAFKANLVLALLHVVQIDSRTFFQSLEWALDEINQDSLDGYLMSKRLEDWRKLMSEFEIEVPAIGRSLAEFVSFVFNDGQGSQPPKEIEIIAEEMQSDINRIQRKLVEVYGALRADMQFAESRRSINEAKTVTKLTELAFLFVPLSFTCSLFSMQINELAGGVPVWTFVVTALGIAIMAYVIRLVLTSEFIADSSRNALEKFWSRTGVRRGDSAPVLTLILLTVQEVWRKTGAEYFMKACVVILLTACVVVPVVFMWTSTRMDIGFDTAMTLFLVLSSLGLGIGLFVNPGSHGERVTAWQGDGASTTSGEDV